MRNNLFSGARAIVLARYATFYQQVQDIVNDTAHSPLRRHDVEHLDRQDDRAAERLFSSATLNYSINHLGKSSLGLSIYLFIFGDLIDAYQSQKVSHAERVVMVLRAKFFKDLWKSFLHEGGYTAQHYFISNDADKIVDTLILGLLGLIFIHRDFLDTSFPLMPWAHRSESNEHVFGIMRSLITDFTMLDVVHMIPKLTVRLQAACRSRHQNVGETAAGYSHTYFHDEDTPLSLFSQYPSDKDLNSLAGVAYDEVCYLWSLLGYKSSEVLSPSRSQPGGPIPDDPDDASEDSEDGATISDRRELLDAIEAIATPTHDGMSREDCSRLHEYTFAAAAFNLQDFSDIDLLQADSDPVILRDLANQVQGILQASESPHKPALATPSNSDISQSTCYVLARKWTLTLGDDTTSAVYRHGLIGSVSRTRDPRELIPSSPPWAVDVYPLGSVYHRVFLYHNERVAKPYGYIYIVDHPSWRTIVPLDEPPINVPQEEDLHAFIALNGDLAPHPAEYPDSITNRLFYRPLRIAASTEA
ncbi:hypothetical protein EDB86DRAFT_3071106 [Lactarius hatsudake]|nr:hypothetical protein EDB86DRAFT_3071106 [Lactarius hatsudake]